MRTLLLQPLQTSAARSRRDSLYRCSRARGRYPFRLLRCLQDRTQLLRRPWLPDSAIGSPGPDSAIGSPVLCPLVPFLVPVRAPICCHSPERREEAVAQYERSAYFVYSTTVTAFIALIISSYILQKLSSLLAGQLKN